MDRNSSEMSRDSTVFGKVAAIFGRGEGLLELREEIEGRQQIRSMRVTLPDRDRNLEVQGGKRKNGRNC